VATSTSQLVGREGELQALEQLLDEARHGRSRFAAISGDPGIGKSSVLAELVRRAGDGCLVLEGRGTELERVFPFGLFVDAFDAYLASLDEHAIGRLGTEELMQLASVFPAIRSLAPQASAPTTAAERFRTYHAARELIERVAARRPLLLLVLDDVHWGDGASIELLCHLLRRAPEAAVMVVMAMRSGQAPAQLEAAIEAAAFAGKCRRIEIGPLERDEARRLVPDAVRDDELLYRESGGNPFYLIQLARRSTTAQPGHESVPDPSGVPPAISAAIAAEMERLADPTQAFARAAAVAGDPFELDLAIAIAPLTEAEALVSLDELVARDIIRPEPVARRFRFRHPLVRQAIYAGASPGVRLAAHERAAAALERHGASATERAHHITQSARRGDLDAVALLREAGHDAAQRAPSSAAAWFAAALRIMPPAATGDERLELLVALSQATAATGRFEESRRALLEALELPDVAVPARMGLVSACARAEMLLGRLGDGQARLDRAIGSLGEEHAVLTGRLLMDSAVVAFYAADFERMRASGLRAVSIARSLGDAPPLAGALASLALAEATAGPVADAEAHSSEAAQLIDAMPDDQLTEWIDALTFLCGAEYGLHRFEETIRHARRGIALSRLRGRGELFPGLAQTLAAGLLSTGRLAEAADVIDDIAESARLSDNAVTLAWSAINRAYVSLEAGALEAALRESEQAVELAEAMDVGVLRAWAGNIRGAALIEAGDPARAAELIVSTGGGEELSLVPGAIRANFLEILTRARIGSGRLADAASSAEAARRRAAEFGLGFSTAVAERASAAVALAMGEPAQAAALATTSADRAAAAGGRLEAALSRLLAGRALTAAGETERAVELLQQASDAFAVCGARRHQAEVERELRRLGRGTYRRSTPGKSDSLGLESLTGRELEILRLVVDRRTNPEIAVELFLSIKTVETHLRNIFRKLGVKTRVEAARLVERERAASG
jgi:ATP/maltotriose-dependent transcriptional regulator MalT